LREVPCYSGPVMLRLSCPRTPANWFLGGELPCILRGDPVPALAADFDRAGELDPKLIAVDASRARLRADAEQSRSALAARNRLRNECESN
jgi:hypothetical protein